MFGNSGGESLALTVNANTADWLLVLSMNCLTNRRPANELPHLVCRSTNDARIKHGPLTVSGLVDHYRLCELKPDTVWKTHSTKVTYQGYLNKWILPRWGACTLAGINAGEVELWLRSLPLARSSCAKIRNLMSTVFNHGIRHGICGRNPIRLVRQSAKRKKIPTVLSPSEVQRLIGLLALRERTLVLLDVGTGLLMSELFPLKWCDINFQDYEVNVSRSMVMQVVGPCKTEASQKPIPLDPYLADVLQQWRKHTRYKGSDDWVFASPETKGQQPYWGQTMMRRIIRPAGSESRDHPAYWLAYLPAYLLIFVECKWR